MPKNITTAQKQAPDFSECESDALAQTNEINCLEKNNNIFLNDAFQSYYDHFQVN